MDAFWSQETSTVSGNFRRLRRYYFDSAKLVSIRIPLAPIKSWIELVCDVRSILCKFHREKGSARIIYSGICGGGLPLGTIMHVKREQYIWRQGPSIWKMKKGV